MGFATVVPLDRLTEPLQSGFMQSAFAGSLLIALTFGMLGVYVVLRRMPFIGDAVAHTALPGLVVAYLKGWNLFGGAVVAGVATALSIGWISRRGIVREDTAVGVVYTGLFALGVAIISVTKSFKDITALLLGNVLAITPQDILIIGIVAVVVIFVLVLLHKEFELSSFDPIHAQVVGLNPDLIRYVLLTLLALAVVAGIQAVGVVLVSGMLITPAATASLLTKRLTRMMAVSVLVAVTAVIAGLYASYFFNIAAGAAIVLASSTCFMLAAAIRAAGSLAPSRA